ncbi:hypothetical protein ABIC08_008994 [Bradyrhizobium sp. RT9b]
MLRLVAAFRFGTQGHEAIIAASPAKRVDLEPKLQ